MNLRSNLSATPVLRLVGGQTEAIAQPVDRGGQWGDADDATRQIIRENRAAALRRDLDPMDPRWVLAAEARNELQGTALPADRRSKLLSLANQLGMRPFDANLVIAIVQDEARLASAGADSTWELADRLQIIPSRDGLRLAPATALPPSAPKRDRRGVPASLLLVLSALLGVAGLVAALNWLMAG